MMKRPLRYLSWIVTIPLGIIVISFAISNRDDVILTLWPLPFETEMPVYLPVLGMLAAGLCIGGAIAWWSGGKYRRLARRQSNRLKRLTAEIEALRGQDTGSPDGRPRPTDPQRLTAAVRATGTTDRAEISRPAQPATLGQP